jgi:folylpolyglutamate synthase
LDDKATMTALPTLHQPVRSYDSAVSELYGPTHQALSKQAIVDATLRRSETVTDMTVYMERLKLDRLNLPMLHITGTKGKGSTACMCEHILRNQGYRTGLFTSPHLIDIRERIRINGKLISKDCFADLYWTIREKLEASTRIDGHNNKNEKDSPQSSLPGYFRMLTLMAVYCFARYEPAIDVMIFEVGMGGRFDATNAISCNGNKICGITLIDYDHMRELGSTLEEIAWHKGGIYTKQKLESNHQLPPLFILDTNQDSVVKVFEQCANDVQGHMQLIGRSTSPVTPSDFPIGLSGQHQRDNAELAMAMCSEFLKTKVCHLSSDLIFRILRSLSSVSWPGRCQTLEGSTESHSLLHPGVTLCLDGGHTIQSIKAGLAWFHGRQNTTSHASLKRALVFNCSHERNPVELLRLFVASEPSFDTVCFARANSERPSAIDKKSAREWLADACMDYDEGLYRPKGSSTWQDTLACLWKHLEHDRGSSSVCTVVANVTVVEALSSLQETLNTDTALHILVSGSLYLVGAALSAVDWKEAEDNGVLKHSQNE